MLTPHSAFRTPHSGAFLIAMEGIDGSGKGTQAGRLHERLVKSGCRAALISFPRYDATLFGKAVGDFLNGRFGTLEQVDPFLVSLLYAGDRYESRGMLLEAIAANDVVVLDRYVPSNIAHQASKLDAARRDELSGWIEQIEYEIYRLPRPDLVLLLDLPASEAQQLIAMKQARTYTDKKADLQETDADYLERVREVYTQLAAADETGWYRIDCSKGEKIRSIEEIGDEIWNVVATRRSR